MTTYQMRMDMRLTQRPLTQFMSFTPLFIGANVNEVMLAGSCGESTESRGMTTRRYNGA